VFSDARFGQIADEKISFLPLYFTASAVSPDQISF